MADCMRASARRRAGCRVVPRLLVGAATLVAMLAVATVSGATTPKCSLTSHCYGIIYSGRTWVGMGASFNRAWMTTPNTVNHKRFMDSEMWLIHNTAEAWVETGINQGYTATYLHESTYQIFYGWQGMPGYAAYGYKVLEYTSPTTSHRDTYYLRQHLNTYDGWNAVFNTTIYDIAHVGFSDGQLEMGAEVATAYGKAKTFTMDSDGETSTGSWTTWKTTTVIWTPSTIAGKTLNGVFTGTATWKWNTVEQ